MLKNKNIKIHQFKTPKYLIPGLIGFFGLLIIAFPKFFITLVGVLFVGFAGLVFYLQRKIKKIKKNFVVSSNMFNFDQDLKDRTVSKKNTKKDIIIH